eukprot:27765-Chlamydomonas_euryale.AAC.1
MVEVQRALLELLPRCSPEVASFKTNYALMNKQHRDIHSLCAEAWAAAEVTPRSAAAGVAGQAADPHAAAADADVAQERALSAVSTGTSPLRARTQTSSRRPSRRLK